MAISMSKALVRLPCTCTPRVRCAACRAWGVRHPIMSNPAMLPRLLARRAHQQARLTEARAELHRLQQQLAQPRGWPLEDVPALRRQRRNRHNMVLWLGKSIANLAQRIAACEAAGDMIEETADDDEA